MPTNQTACAIRLSHLGDIALTTGVLDYWQRTRGLDFVFFTRPGPAQLLTGHPAVREVVELDGPELSGAAWVRRAGELAGQYEGLPLIDLHGTLRSRILSLRWHGPVRRYPKFGLQRRLFQRFGIPVLGRRLEATCVTQRYALALEKTPPSPSELLPHIELTPEETAAATRKVQAATNGPDSPREDSRVVALHPYATHPNKAWPREHWLELADMLTRAGLGWIVVGRDGSPLFPGDPRDFTNRAALRETCALIHACQALATNDSGPMHLAAAVDTPVAALFGPTHRAWGFAPQGPGDQLLERPMDCRPCSLHGSRPCGRGLACLASIPPEEMMVALTLAMAVTSTPRT